MPAVPRHRPDDHQAVPDLPGRGRVPRERKITVKIPAGIATGQQLRLQGEGEAGTGGGPPAISTSSIHVQEHEFFRRDGLNLFCEIPVNFTTLALGGEIQVPTLDGAETVKVPEGTQTGTTLRLRGKGMPDVNGRGQRRSVRDRAGADAEEADQGTASRCSSSSRRRCQGEVRAARASEEQDERNLFDRVKDMFG